MLQVIRTVLLEILKEAQHAGEVLSSYDPVSTPKKNRRKINLPRLGDISNKKFSDVWDDHLHALQEKTGSKKAIPLSLRPTQLTGAYRT